MFSPQKQPQKVQDTVQICLAKRKKNGCRWSSKYVVRAACDWIKRPFCVSAQLNTAHTTYYIAKKRRRTNFTRIKYIAENYIDAHSITNSRNCQFGVDFFVSIQNLTHTHTHLCQNVNEAKVKLTCRFRPQIQTAYFISVQTYNLFRCQWTNSQRIENAESIT